MLYKLSKQKNILIQKSIMVDSAIFKLMKKHLTPPDPVTLMMWLKSLDDTVCNG